MICRKVNDLCATWNEENGECESCYRGYRLQDGRCGSLTGGDLDPGCNTFNWTALTCLKCSFRFYFEDDKCMAVDDLCKGFDEDNGDCTSCYGGYMLDGVKCIREDMAN